MNGIAHVRGGCDEEGEAEEEGGRPPMTQSIVNVIVVAFEKRRNFRETKQQLVTHLRSAVTSRENSSVFGPLQKINNYRIM